MFSSRGFSRALLVGAAVALSAGPAWAAAPEAPKSSTIDELETFMTVFERVKAQYVKSVDDHTLIKGAIDGMLNALDPHSSYAEGADFQDLRQIATGDYAGIGVVTTLDDGLLRVVSTTEDGPAWKAGVKPGDYITRVDNELIYGRTLDEAAGKLRGDPGSKVQLTIRRAGTPAAISASIVRSVIDLHPVKWEVRNGVGVINLNIFNGKSAEETRDAINAIKAKVGGTPVGFILDLRNNGGGVVEEAVDIADLFLEQGEVVSQRGRTNESIRRYYARTGDLTGGRPVIVLIDAGSASASEIVAGALQDHHRALVLGERSFGKGSMQSIMQIGPDQALRLTTELYYLPSGRSIQEVGIDPDIIVPQMSDAARLNRTNVRESDLRRHLIAEASSDVSALEENDPPDPRFLVTAAALKKRGVDDFQLDYAVNVIRRVGAPTIADGSGAPATSPTPPAG